MQVHRLPGSGHRVAEAGEPRHAESPGDEDWAEGGPHQVGLKSPLQRAGGEGGVKCRSDPYTEFI